jgi:RNA polymerase sigma-70 factor (ECF subfamily)
MADRRSNQEWLTALRGPDQAQALEELRLKLGRGLSAALAGRIAAEYETVIEDFVQEALLKILNNLDTFRGESQFLTWAQKIALRVAFSELRRRRWRDISLEDLQPADQETDYTPASLADPQPTPEQRADQRQALALVRRIIDEELTERQRQVIFAVMEGGMPLEVAAERMGTNRNALYKLLYDARQKLGRRLHEYGFTPQEILAIFER